MIDISRLRVSTTKNGFMRIADVLRRHPRWEVLENVSGTYPDIDVKRSQAAKILDEMPGGNVPEFWDEIRSQTDEAINAFVFVTYAGYRPNRLFFLMR